MKSIQKHKGFTLIELMVVIVIIGILATLGLMSYRNALIRGRDSKAMGDLKDIAAAQEQYKAVRGINGAYVDISSSNGAACSTSAIDDFTVPSSSSSNAYNCWGDTTTYCVSVLMERAGNGNCSSCSCSGGVCSFTPTNSGNYFCVANKQ